MLSNTGFLILAAACIAASLPLLMYFGVVFYHKTKYVVGCVLDKDFFQRKRCEAALARVITVHQLVDNDFVSKFRFRVNEFPNRIQLLTALRKYNPHIVDLVGFGDNMRVVLGQVGVREVHEIQRREAERLAEETKMDCDEWPCHKPGHEEKHRLMFEKSKEISEVSLEDQLKEAKVEIEKLHKAKAVDKIRELYKSQADDKLAHSVKVLSNMLQEDHPHLVAVRAEAETRLALYKANNPESVVSSKKVVKKAKKKSVKRGRSHRPRA